MSSQALAWAKKQQVGDPIAKLVLLLISDRAAAAHDDIFSWTLDADTLVREAEISERAVLTALVTLEQHGIIERRGSATTPTATTVFLEVDA